MSNRTALILSIVGIIVALVCIVWSTYTLCTDVLPYDWSTSYATSTP